MSPLEIAARIILAIAAIIGVVVGVFWIVRPRGR
jgi:hypothetical protein